MKKYISTNYTSTVEIVYTIERRPIYLVYTIILPITLINFITLLAFVLPADSGERVSFATTMLLTLTMYMTIMSDSIPNTSESVSILTISLTIKLIFNALIVLSVIITLCVYNTSEDKPVPQWILFLCKRKRGQLDYVGPQVDAAGEKMEAEKNNTVNRLNVHSNVGVFTWPAVGRRLDLFFFVLFTVMIFTETVVNIIRITHHR
ncbi:Acetylcholine receptor subunit alpha [Mizuhopecten yessoensis]|uniref:Acetylcholine receptor subunit alpha n=1 Tax=Mizuhopecten yessoensis TaxID=6573 RepID=A0A210QIT1_MIZYE|nr:Acetylcholine receptor subunit alpha [Mizuhopecten yessoensis]